MLMNGKEVNHLVIGGETFDRNFCMHRIRFLKNFASNDGWVSLTGIAMDSGRGGIAVDKGNTGYTILKYKNGYCVYLDRDAFRTGFWVTEDRIEFIDDDKTGGGVNSPFYLLLLYCSISLLALGVLLSC